MHGKFVRIFPPICVAILLISAAAIPSGAQTSAGQATAAPAAAKTPAEAATRASTYSYARIVRLSYTDGDVQIVRPNVSAKPKWEPAFANMPLQQGFALGTNDGRAEIEFEHGSMMWLAGDSLAQFTQLALSNGGRITQVTLARGTASFSTNLTAGDSFRIALPQLEVTAGGDAEFRVDAFHDGVALRVLKGSVTATPSAALAIPARELARGQRIRLTTGNHPELAVASNPAPDGWDQWVTMRRNAALYGEQQAEKHANAPVSYGLADLSMFGNWNNCGSYGYGWQPFGMTASWAPFMNGQWMFYPGMGWTWVSYEPWGWMPYHFGGWASAPGCGWAWFPGSEGYGFWNPAPVQWFATGGNIGWRPLPPTGLRPVSPVGGGGHGRTPLPPGAPMPVVVSTKPLGKLGTYRLLSEGRGAAPVQALAAAPLSNGKLAPAEAPAGISSHLIASAKDMRSAQASRGEFVVPTARNLGALQSAAFAGKTLAAPRFTNAMPALESKPAGANSSPRGPVISNAMPMAPARLPSPPQARPIGPRDFGGFPSPSAGMGGARESEPGPLGARGSGSRSSEPVSAPSSGVESPRGGSTLPSPGSTSGGAPAGSVRH